MYFSDRREAGRALAAQLDHLGGPDLLVLGLPRGGVPVAAEVAAALDAPLDVLLVRKLGVPGHRELAMGAIGEGGVRVLNDSVLRQAGVSPARLDAVDREEQAVLDERVRRYRGSRPAPDLRGRTVVIVDDGIATGATARAACAVARAAGAAYIVLATPVAPPGWTHPFAGLADETLALDTPPDFMGVGQFYDDFRQTTDGEVLDCLDRASPRTNRP